MLFSGTETKHLVLVPLLNGDDDDDGALEGMDDVNESGLFFMPENKWV